jgi:TRAP-type C4-dicarboxylate transport system permease small subunit
MTSKAKPTWAGPAKIADRLLTLLISATAIISGTTILLMCALIAVNVIARQVFNRPFLDTVLLGSLAIVIMTYVGLAWVYRLGEHVSVRILVDHLSWRKRLSLRLILLAFSLVALAVAIYQTWSFAWAGFQMNERLRGMFSVDAFPFHVLMPIGLGLLGIEVVRSIVLGLAALVQNRPELVDEGQSAGRAE